MRFPFALWAHASFWISAKAADFSEFWLRMGIWGKNRSILSDDDRRRGL